MSRCPHCSFNPTSLPDYCSKHEPVTGPSIDLNDVIHNPRNYLLDGQHLIRATLKVETDGEAVLVHQWDHNLQIQRISRVKE